MAKPQGLGGRQLVHPWLFAYGAHAFIVRPTLPSASSPPPSACPKTTQALYKLMVRALVGPPPPPRTKPPKPTTNSLHHCIYCTRGWLPHQCPPCKHVTKQQRANGLVWPYPLVRSYDQPPLLPGCGGHMDLELFPRRRVSCVCPQPP